MLAALYVQTWLRPTRWRWLVVCVVGAAVGKYIHPILPALVLALVLCGLVAALILGRSRQVPLDVDGETDAPLWRLLFRAVALYLAMVGPVFLDVWLKSPHGVRTYPFTWEYIVPVALDLENAILPQVGPVLAMRLAGVYLGLNLLLLGIAWRRKLVVV